MGFDPFSKLAGSQQTTRLILLAIILLTVPCYCLGAVLLAYAPDNQTPTPFDPRATLGGATSQMTPSPTWTPFRTSTPGGGALQPTPGQIFLITTVPPMIIPTATLTLTPTSTIMPTLTTAPTLTIVPTNTLPPSPTITNTLPPTETLTLTPTWTLSPTPTTEPIIEPTPTQETNP